MNNLIRIFFVFVCLAVLFEKKLTAQNLELAPEQIMQLNRAGKWAQAAESAQKFLASNLSKTIEQKCEVFYNLAYSQTRLNQIANAETTLARFDGECRTLSPGSKWVYAEIARLRKDLSAEKSGVAQSPPTIAADNFWQTAAPASLGLNVSALESHRKLCERSGADACTVIYKGKIVQEFYSERYRLPMMAMSSTKSITGILVGMLIDDGKIKSLDEPVCTYISEWCQGNKGKVTLRHLLTMTSGLPRIYEGGVGSAKSAGDKNAFVIKQSLAADPGTTWAYSNEGVQLLSPILDKAAGEPIQDYARKRLFEPLGMKETRLHLDSQKHAWTYADMETSARDFARIGLLMLNNGLWRNQRIVSRDWVEQSARKSQKFENYGLLWWLYDTPKGYGAQGYLDTNLYVFPKQDLIVVRMQSKPQAQYVPYEKEALKLFGQLKEK